MADRHHTDPIHSTPHPGLARGRGPRPRRQARRTLVLYGLGAVWAVVSIVIGYSLGAPYLKGRQPQGERVAFDHRASLARDVETSAGWSAQPTVPNSPTGGDEFAASREAFARELRRARLWTWLAVALAGTMAIVSIVLVVRLRRTTLTLRRRDEDVFGETPIGSHASAPWTAAPPPSPIELLTAARADLDEARREAGEALSVDPTLLGREETLPLQAALLDEELIKLRRSRIALENRFSANLALGFDAELQGRVARGGNLIKNPSGPGCESSNVESPP